MRILFIRWGAIGDCLIVTPLIRYLHNQGHEVYVSASNSGQEIWKHNPHIAKLIPYKADSVPDDKLQDYWEQLRIENACDIKINMCESLERSLSPHPFDPIYNATKAKRRERCDKNFYEYAFTHAFNQHSELQEIMDDGSIYYGGKRIIPEIFFTDSEESDMQKYFTNLGKNPVIIWGLSGSALNKAYPYTHNIIADLLREYPKLRIITVGSKLEEVLEVGLPDKVIKKSGKWSIRESILACKYANLVVATDTGLLHGSGCFETPKIGLIGSNTINNVTKHFINDHSFETDAEKVPCAPCFRIIYEASTQCPIDPVFDLPHCMTKGIDPEKVFNKVKEIIDATGYKKGSPLSDMLSLTKRMLQPSNN